jgi:hypothetical protein
LNPRTVDSSIYPYTVRCRGRRDKRRFLGFDPAGESLANHACLVRDPLVAPLGFSLSGLSGDDLAGDFAPAPLTRFFGLTCVGPPAPQSLDRSSLRLIRPLARVWVGHPLRVSAPSWSCSFEFAIVPGYVFTLHPRHALLQASTECSLGDCKLYRSCQDQLEVLSIATTNLSQTSLRTKQANASQFHNKVKTVPIWSSEITIR